MDSNTPGKTAKRILGDHGEDRACEHYIALGYEIIARNVQLARIGEIDIVATHHVDNVTEYVFIEVKTRTSSRMGYGFEAITHTKRKRMIRCALAWMGSHAGRSRGRTMWRLDVVSIDLSLQGPDIQVFEHVEVN